jgi:hypothetical protein
MEFLEHYASIEALTRENQTAVLAVFKTDVNQFYASVQAFDSDPETQNLVDNIKYNMDIDRHVVLDHDVPFEKIVRILTEKINMLKMAEACSSAEEFLAFECKIADEIFKKFSMEEEAVRKAIGKYRSNRIVKKYKWRVEEEFNRLFEPALLPKFSFA